MRLKKYNKSIGMLSLFASALMLSGCNTALMDPKGAIGLEQRTLILTAIGLMLIVVIPVIIMAFAFAWKYRASNTKQPTVLTGPTPTKLKPSSGLFQLLSLPFWQRLPGRPPMRLIRSSQSYLTKNR